MSYERGRRSIASNMATRGRVWSDDEVAALLACWSEDSIQRQLLGAVRNTVPYKAIAEELSRQGFSRDFKQCREKIKALKKRYKEVVDAQRRSGAGVESDDDDLEDVPGFRWFAEIHSVMRTRAVVSPPALLDTSVAAEEQPRTPPHVDIQKSIFMVHQCLQYHRMISLSVVIIQGILRGGDDGNVRAIDCTDALRKPPLG